MSGRRFPDEINSNLANGEHLRDFVLLCANLANGPCVYYSWIALMCSVAHFLFIYVSAMTIQDMEHLLAR